MVVDKWYVCKGCDYSFCYGSGYGCAYYTDRHGHRPCKAGTGCTVRKGEPEPEVKCLKSSHKWDKEKALELCRQGKTVAEIAHEVGVREGTIYDYLHICGMKARSPNQHRGPKWDTEKAMELYRQGKTASEIAQVVGANHETVRRWFYKRGYYANTKHNRGYREDGSAI